jgi:hypothetical protein
MGGLLDPGADNVGLGTMGIDVVGPILRVVFDDEDRRALPDGTLADGFHHRASVSHGRYRLMTLA